MDNSIIDAVFGPIMGLLGIGLSFMALFIIYKAVTLKNKERMALIEKGMDPSLAEKKPSGDKQGALKNGMVILGLALGILMGYVLTLIINIPDFVAYASMILVFGGLALMLQYVILQKKEQ